MNTSPGTKDMLVIDNKEFTLNQFINAIPPWKIHDIKNLSEKEIANIIETNRYKLTNNSLASREVELTDSFGETRNVSSYIKEAVETYNDASLKFCFVRGKDPTWTTKQKLEYHGYSYSSNEKLVFLFEAFSNKGFYLYEGFYKNAGAGITTDIKNDHKFSFVEMNIDGETKVNSLRTGEILSSTYSLYRYRYISLIKKNKPELFTNKLNIKKENEIKYSPNLIVVPKNKTYYDIDQKILEDFTGEVIISTDYGLTDRNFYVNGGIKFQNSIYNDSVIDSHFFSHKKMNLVLLHREDGPARIETKKAFLKAEEYYLYGHLIDKKEFATKVKELYSVDLILFTEEQVPEKFTGSCINVSISLETKHYVDGKIVEDKSSEIASSEIDLLKEQIKELTTVVNELKKSINLSQKKESENVVVQSKVLKIVKSDAKEVAKRIAAEKIKSLMKDILIKLLKSNKTKNVSSIQDFLNTEYGLAAIGICSSFILSNIASRLEEKYSQPLLQISEELRISSEVELTTEALDKLSVVFNNVLTQKEQELLVRVAVDSENNLNSAFEDTQEAVREPFKMIVG